MRLSEGQKEAIRDLGRLAAATDGFDVLRMPDGTDHIGWARVVVTCDTSGFERQPGGFAMADREVFEIDIPYHYPHDLPAVQAAHYNWAEREHVVFGKVLCLYRAPDVEWDSALGVLGFVAKLEQWLRDAAANALDAVGAPMHPPVAYPERPDASTVVVRANTPVVTGTWHGFAQLHEVRPDRFDVVAWIGGGVTDLRGPVALVVLTSGALGAAYPSTVQELVGLLEGMGAPLERDRMRRAVLVNPAGSPLFVVVGTPHRGVVGEAMAQHLVVWGIPSDQADQMRDFWRPGRDADGVRDKDAQQAASDALDRWAATSRVDWCHVQDARTEVTVRRDAETPAAVFHGKVVEIWGCGALGGWAVELIARSKPRKVILRDNRRVSVGSLVRQPYTDADVGLGKAEALAARLLAIDPKLDVVPRDTELVSWLAQGNSPRDADVVINATASRRVETAFERASPLRPRVPLATLGIDGAAAVGRLVWCPRGYTDGSAGAKRKLRLLLEEAGGHDDLLAAFWARRDTPFVPEPGCSEPTFVGSAADVLGLAAQLVNGVAGLMASSDDDEARVLFVSSASHPEVLSPRWFRAAPDMVLTAGTYRVHVASSATAALDAEIDRSAVSRGPEVETGGLLFGDIDPAGRRAWVTCATPPPSDSEHAPTGFVCGTAGTKWRAGTLRRRHGAAARFIGTWHTHPGGSASPSPTDIKTMARLSAATDTKLGTGLLLVVGGTRSSPALSAAILDAADTE